MYHGRFPNPNDTVTVPDTPPLAAPSRRRFLKLAGVFLFGSVAGGYLLRDAFTGSVDDGDDAHRAKPQRDEDPNSGDPQALERGSLAWALAMANEDDAALLAAAGDLERVSLRYRDDERLDTCYERLLDVALRSATAEADAAAACAIRSLVRLGSAEMVLDRERDVAARNDFVEAPRALERARRSTGRR